MKFKANNSLFQILTIGVFLVFAISCAKNDTDNEPSPIDPTNPTNGKTTAIFNSNISYGTMTDQDGNVYKTITLGSQTWMAENLRTTKYNDSTAIPKVTSNIEWVTLETGAYCNYRNVTNNDTIATYGRLYNWYAINTGKLAPIGWHVPTDAEWTTLISYLGGELVAGGKLREAGTTHWRSPNVGATNESGFTALPSGMRWENGSCYDIGEFCYWWSANEHDVQNALYRYTHTSHSTFYSGGHYKTLGLSIRCVKD